MGAWEPSGEQCVVEHDGLELTRTARLLTPNWSPLAHWCGCRVPMELAGRGPRSAAGPTATRPQFNPS